jgi:hypothetical protein
MVMYPYKGVPSKITKTGPVDWGLGHSPTGFMRAEGIYKYFGQVSAPHLGKCNVKFPVILFISGNCTHLTHQLSELCSELSIILIYLCASTTRLFQPLDAATFR